MKKNIILAAVVLVIALSIIALESQKADAPVQVGNKDIAVDTSLSDSDRVVEKEKLYERAKEISTPDGFINVDEISVGEFIGKKVVLIDFWTYSCINCQRTLPYLNNWYEKYADDGLVIIGIHTPEFEFEKDLGNVQKAVEKWGIEFPVVLDNDYSTWRSYKNRYWPRKYLIDIDGYIVYDHIGEGKYDETEAKIVELLNEKNQVLGMEAVKKDARIPENVDVVDVTKARSPETYLGNGRVEHLENKGENCKNDTCDYTVGASATLGKFKLAGTWNSQEEFIRLEEGTGSIFIHFLGKKVNLVAQSPQPVNATLYLDGTPIEQKNAGYSVEDGVVTFSDSDLYNLVDLDQGNSQHILEIRFSEPGVEAFAFTFG